MLSQSDLLTKDPNELYIAYDLGIPVDLPKLLASLQINLNQEFDFDKLGYSGEIYWDNDVVNIWVNPTDIEQRQRFTIAHEIGHFILHMLPHIEDRSIEFKDDIKNLKRSDIWDAKEYEANNFAARLLMPKSAIMDSLLQIAQEYKAQGSSKITLDDLLEIMASKFNVSKLAMKFRLKNLGIIKNT